MAKYIVNDLHLYIIYKPWWFPMNKDEKEMGGYDFTSRGSERPWGGGPKGVSNLLCKPQL